MDLHLRTSSLLKHWDFILQLKRTSLSKNNKPLSNYRRHCSTVTAQLCVKIISIISTFAFVVEVCVVVAVFQGAFSPAAGGNSFKYRQFPPWILLLEEPEKSQKRVCLGAGQAFQLLASLNRRSESSQRGGSGTYQYPATMLRA